MGSKFARSACGTKRKARAAARCEIAGVAKRPAAERAPAAAVDFRNALRSMMVLLVRLPCRLAGKFRAGMRVVSSKMSLTGQSHADGRHRPGALFSKCTQSCAVEKDVIGSW